MLERCRLEVSQAADQLEVFDGGEIAVEFGFLRDVADDLLAPPDSEVPYGTLDLMVLKTLASMGPLRASSVDRQQENTRECKVTGSKLQGCLQHTLRQLPDRHLPRLG